MSLWKYKYFLDVVELKSFTKAGARNYVTQTAVSQQIASLEKMAGGTLLERGNGEICLTELGEIVYEYAREMVQTYERMLHEIERYKESSVVRIGIDSSINNTENGICNIYQVSTYFGVSLEAATNRGKWLGILKW